MDSTLLWMPIIVTDVRCSHHAPRTLLLRNSSAEILPTFMADPGSLRSLCLSPSSFQRRSLSPYSGLASVPDGPVPHGLPCRFCLLRYRFLSLDLMQMSPCSGFPTLSVDLYGFRTGSFTLCSRPLWISYRPSSFCLIFFPNGPYPETYLIHRSSTIRHTTDELLALTPCETFDD